jgi:AcrR family transcriptional regulator
MTVEETEGGRRRTGEHGARVGGRSERVVRDVLHATTTELSRVGYAALRVDDVAAAAGVNKTTVYRRWPTKAELVSSALRCRTMQADELPDTGAVRTDLLELLRHQVKIVSTPEGQAIMRMMLAEMDQPEVAALSAALREEKLALWTVVIQRAMTRGEIPAGSDVQLLVEMLGGAVFSRLRLRELVDEAYLGAVVNLVVLGAQQGGAIRG